MTYPPQRPRPGPYHPYGQQQASQPYGSHGQQTGYPGPGGYPGDSGYPGDEPPRKGRTGLIVAIVLVAVLVLGGAGAAIYFVTTGDDASGDSAKNGPSAVTEAYIEAYETKSFGSVVNSACSAYKEKHGTQTTKLEQTLRPYDIKAKAEGEPDVSGSTATAKIELELTKDGKTERPKIQITIVKEAGEWRFCGENKG